jgi:hypothetical protein
MSAERRDDLTPEERDIIARAAAAAPPAPEPRWGDYRAELHARLEARRSIGARLGHWWARPAPIAVSVGLAAALVLVAVRPSEILHRADRRPDLTAVDETVLGDRIGLIEHYQIVERLDLLEDLDVIRQLDRVQLREG